MSSFRTAIFTATLLMANVVWAEAQNPLMAERFLAGEHYEVLEVPVGTRDSDKVEVVEMFSYACIHCFNFEPYVKAWSAKQDEGVDFYVVPAIFNADWERLAQAYYTADALGVVDQVHARMFDGIHNRNEDLRQPQILAPIYQELGGVSESDFGAAFSSFSVKSRVQQAKAKGRAYQITGVPTMIVNGKYRTDGRMAGGNAAMLEVVDFLVAKEKAAGAE